MIGLLLAGACRVEAAPLRPPEGRVLVMIGQDRDSVAPYVAATGLPPSGVMAYTSLQELQGLDEAMDYGGGVQHARALLDAQPHAVLQLGLWMVGALESIALREMDGQIDRLARWCRDTGRPVYLRIGYEFDFPQNGYQPELYVHAYRRIVDRFREAAVDNVAFVWHSYADRAVRPLADWYPGDAYVDWVGVSYWEAAQRPSLDAVADFADAHGKPLMVAEATARTIGTRQGARSWETWFAPFFAFVRERGVQAISYIEWDWETIPMFRGQGWGDARLSADQTVRGRWVEEVSQPAYLHGSPALFGLLRSD